MHFDIILPTIARDSLHTAIESVLNQTYHDWQLVIVMDNCAFRIPKIDSRISFTPTSGPVDFGARARNTGIERTSAEWIAYIDDDDEWHPDHLATHVRMIEENPDVTMTRTAGQSFMMKHKHPRTSKLVRKMGAVNSTDLLTVGMAHTREVFNETDGWQPCDNHDHILWKQMLLSGGTPSESDAVTYDFRR